MSGNAVALESERTGGSINTIEIEKEKVIVKKEEVKKTDLKEIRFARLKKSIRKRAANIF